LAQAVISGISPFFIVSHVPSSLSFYRDRLGFEITFQGPAPDDIFFGLTLTTYAISTGFFAHRILQLPEYMRDYTYHGYTSPEIYLSTNYSELFGLQLLSWGISVVGLFVLTGTAGWCLGRFRRRAQAA